MKKKKRKKANDIYENEQRRWSSSETRRRLARPIYDHAIFAESQSKSHLYIPSSRSSTKKFPNFRIKRDPWEGCIRARVLLLFPENYFQLKSPSAAWMIWRKNEERISWPTRSMGKKSRRASLSKQREGRGGGRGRGVVKRKTRGDKQREITGYREQTFPRKNGGLVQRWKIKWLAKRVCVCACVRVCCCTSQNNNYMGQCSRCVGGTVAARHIVINLVPSAPFYAHVGTPTACLKKYGRYAIVAIGEKCNEFLFSLISCNFSSCHRWLEKNISRYWEP